MKRIAIITGASSGLGKGFAEAIENEMTLDEIWLIARREERLQEVAGKLAAKAIPLALDLAKEEGLQRFHERLQAEEVDILCLVNAAGFGKIGDIKDEPLQEASDMINLNCRALAQITRDCLPHMKKGAWIIQIASIAAFQPMPGLAVYAASKAFVESYAKALHEEIRKDGIHVTCLCPYWVTDTEFIPVASSENKTDYKRTPFATKTTQVVAEAIKAARNNRLICTPGVVSTFLKYSTKVIPDGLLIKIFNLYRKL